MLEQLQESLAGKVVVNVIAPMQFQRGRGASAVEVPAGSAAQEAQELLPNSWVVAAFQNVSAVELQEPDKTMEGDVIVCSNHRESKERVMDLVRKIPSLRPVDGGGLANAKYVEQITPMRRGRLNDPRTGSRMRGEGPYARQVADMFAIARRRAGIPSRTPAVTMRSPAGLKAACHTVSV